MNPLQTRKRFVDLLLGRLPAAEAAETRTALADSPELSREFREFEKLYEVLKSMASEQYHAGPDFAVKVMEQIETQQHGWRQRLLSWRVRGWQGLAWTAGMALLITGGQVLLNNGYRRSEPTVQPAAVQQVTSSSCASAGCASSTVTVTPPAAEQRRPAALLETQPLAPEIAPLTAAKEQSMTPSEALAGREKGKDLPSVAGYAGMAQPAAPNMPEQEDNLAAAGAPAPAVPVPHARGRAVATMAERANSAAESGALMKKTDSAFSSDLIQANRNLIGAVPELEIRTQAAPATIASGVYGEYRKNERVLAKDNPLSTFGLEVDTGSYTNVRKMIRAGQLPPVGAVRIEEMVNYFDYSYPPAADGRPFAVNYEVAPSPLSKGCHLLKLGVRTKAEALHPDRGWNLVFLIDVSGSMSDTDKLPLLKQAFRSLVEHMRPVDRLALVTYADSATVVLPSVSGADKARITAAIDSLQASGGTNGAGGIDLAYQLAEQNRQNASVNRVILATDGDFNVGNYSFDGLMRLVEAKKKSGISLTTLGVGTGNYNEHNMEQLADRGNGNYFYLDNLESAQRVLGDKLTSTMTIVAKDVKAQIEFNPAFVKAYRLIGYENRALAARDFNNDAVDSGEIGSDQTVTVLYEVIFNDSPLASQIDSDLRYQAAGPQRSLNELAKESGELAFVRIRYKEPENDVSKLLEYPLSMAKRATTVDEATPDFRFAAAVSAFGEILSHGRYQNGSTLEDVAQLAQSSVAGEFAAERNDFVILVRQTAALIGGGYGIRDR